MNNDKIVISVEGRTAGAEHLEHMAVFVIENRLADMMLQDDCATPCH